MFRPVSPASPADFLGGCLEAELDAACLRARNRTFENEEELAGAMLAIGHRILDMPAHTPEGMRLKVSVRGKMQVDNSSDEAILELIARDLGIDDLDAEILHGVNYGA